MHATTLDRHIRRHFPRADKGVATHILDACRTTGLHISYALALVEKESGFANVFGHDAVRNPIKGGRVTRARYLLYRFYRRRGLGMQGVGYTQLTWFAFQDQADRVGGCWRPYPNMVVGFRTLQQNIAQHGVREGAARYNGTGPAAEAYGRDFVVRQQRWHVEIT